MRQAAMAGYHIGLTVAPIIPVPDWREAYDALLADCATALEGAPDPDLTVELITHRFTEGSQKVLQGWYPGSALEMDPAQRTRKLTKFGTGKYVFPRERMAELRAGLEAGVARHLPQARVLYWT
jgi:spore photoproduct lyase